MTDVLAEIPSFDYLEGFDEIAPQIRAAVERVFASGRLILGEEVRGFEDEFSAHLGGEGGSVGVGNGTDALSIALRALGVGEGDEVITTSNSGIPTVAAIRMAGATPVYCDVRPDTCLMDLTHLESRVSARTRAVIAVHLFGNVVDMDALSEIAAARRIAVVEDCAQSAGATWKGKATGTFGDAGCFSFYPTKNLGALGDGGICFSRDPERVARMRSIRFYGCEERYCSEREGVNSRLDEVQAAILRIKLGLLPRYVERRRAVAALYDRNLSQAVERVETTEGAGHAHHLYVVKVDRRESLMARLREEKIGCGIHYPMPVHRMPGYAVPGCGPGALPVTEALAERVLSLPCYPELPESAVLRVCEVVNDEVAGRT
jgi:aminotransferase EvaB